MLCSGQMLFPVFTYCYCYLFESTLYQLRGSWWPPPPSSLSPGSKANSSRFSNTPDTPRVNPNAVQTSLQPYNTAQGGNTVPSHVAIEGQAHFNLSTEAKKTIQMTLSADLGRVRVWVQGEKGGGAVLVARPYECCL